MTPSLSVYLWCVFRSEYRDSEFVSVFVVCVQE